MADRGTDTTDADDDNGGFPVGEDDGLVTDSTGHTTVRGEDGEGGTGDTDAEEPTQSDDEPQGADDGDGDSDDGEGEGEDASDDDGDDEPNDDDGEKKEIELDDGTKVDSHVLTKAWQQHASNTRKGQDLAAERKLVQEAAEAFDGGSAKVKAVHERITTWLKENLLPEPTEADYAKDEKAAARQQRLHDKQQKALKEFLELGGEVDEATKEVSAKELKAQAEKFAADLLTARPNLSDSGEMEKFIAANKKTAKEFGFTDEEMDGPIDPRYHELLHFAALGKKAKTAKSSGKPRTTSTRKTRTTSLKRSDNVAAMKRLNKTGSVADALKVDWE